MAEILERLKAALADRYTLERELGRGGMATVYHAQDLQHDRWVALKVLHPQLAAALGPERFLGDTKGQASLVLRPTSPRLSPRRWGTHTLGHD